MRAFYCAIARVRGYTHHCARRGYLQCFACAHNYKPTTNQPAPPTMKRNV